MKKIIFSIFLMNSSFAWTLAGKNVQGFPKSEIQINIASTSCSNAGFSTTELKEYVKEAVDKFWNQVPTSAIKLTVGSVTTTDIDGDTSSSAVAAKATLNTVLIGCNDDVASFSNGFTGGVGTISCNSNGDCRGGVIINAHSSTTVDTYSHDEILSLVAHELGHSIGLGHSSVEEALMYYSLGGKSQEFLHQDDMNGITWLYPNSKELGGLMGSCGTIDTKNDSGQRILLSFLVLLSLITMSYMKQRFIKTSEAK